MNSCSLSNQNMYFITFTLRFVDLVSWDPDTQYIWQIVYYYQTYYTLKIVLTRSVWFTVSNIYIFSDAYGFNHIKNKYFDVRGINQRSRLTNYERN